MADLALIGSQSANHTHCPISHTPRPNLLHSWKQVMRFAHHLSSHLTPEWRKHYIDYNDLKGRIYQMVGKQVVKEGDLGNLGGGWT